MAEGGGRVQISRPAAHLVLRCRRLVVVEEGERGVRAGDALETSSQINKLSQRFSNFQDIAKQSPCSWRSWLSSLYVQVTGNNSKLSQEHNALYDAKATKATTAPITVQMNEWLHELTSQHTSAEKT